MLEKLVNRARKHDKQHANNAITYQQHAKI